MLSRVRFRKFLLACGVLGCAINLNAQSPEPTTKQVAIKELLSLIRATETAKTIFVTLIDQYSRAMATDSVDKFATQAGSPQAKAKMKELIEEFYTRLSQRLQEEVPTRIRYDEVLTGLYVDAYDREFSEPEIAQLIAFYKTPTGTKMLSFGPKVGASLQQKFAEVAGAPIMSITRGIVDEEIQRLAEKCAAVPELRAPRRQRKN